MDTVDEYYFFHNGDLVKTMAKNLADKVFAESVNAYGLYYDGSIKHEVEYHAKGKFGIFEFDFKWTSYQTRPVVLH